MGDRSLPPVLPVGTQVVTRGAVPSDQTTAARAAGAVGVVVDASGDPPRYRVRFPDGGEATLDRRQLTVRKHFQRDGLERPSDWASARDLRRFVVLRCVVGSRAYGLDDEGSDVDRRGVYLPPADLHWSLFGVPEQIDDPATEEVYWELQKFLALALKANPNVLECLHTPLVELATPIGEELLALRSAFLSRLVYQTYNGYVLSQFKKMEQDLRARGEVKWKHAMHLIRLLLSGTAVLRDGLVPLRVDEHRDRLLAIKHGLVPWPEVERWRLDLHRAFDQAFARTRLPERPDYARVDAFLLRARRSMA